MQRHLKMWISMLLVTLAAILPKRIQAQNALVDGNFDKVASSGWARDIKSSTVPGPDLSSNDPNDPTRLIGAGWKRGLFVGNGPDPSAQVAPLVPPFANVLEILRANAGGAGEGGIVYQDVNIDMTNISSVTLSADVRIDSHSLPGSGAEYPIQLLVGWTDASGKFHWDDGVDFSHYVQAFYLNKGNAISRSQQIPANIWHHYISPNLKTLFPNVVRIDRVGIGFGGWDYHSYCDNLSLTLMQDVIVFSSNGEIWRVNPDGSCLQQITTDGGNKGGPSISPDGAKIAFGKQDGGLWVMNADGSDATLVCNNGTRSKTGWSPEGNKILYMLPNVCNEDIGMANSNGSGCQPFLDGSVAGVSGPVTQYADWSSKNRIVFNSHFCGGTCTQGILYAINPDKTGLQQIGFGGWANWFPDGNKIVYDRCGNIYLANADGSSEKQLTVGGKSIYPCPSPDGTKIVFFRDNNLWTMNADGANQQQMTHSRFPDAQPDWGPMIIVPPPVANAGPDKEICLRQPVRLGGNPTAMNGTPPYTFSWTPTIGLDNAATANPIATPASTTTYTVEVTDAKGYKATDELTVKVHNLVLLADSSIWISRNINSEGNINSNGKIEFARGAPSMHLGNLTALTDITIRELNTIVGNATAGNRIYVFGTANVTGVKTEHATLKTIPLSTLAFTAGGPNKIVATNGALALPPRSYGAVTVNDNGALYLSAGNYFMNALVTKTSGTLVIDVSRGPVNIEVVNNLSFGFRTQVFITGTGASTEKATFLTLKDAKVIIDRESLIQGSLIAQNGATVQFYRDCRFQGAICAKSIILGANMRFSPHTSTGVITKPAELAQNEDKQSAMTSVVKSYGLSQNYPNPFSQIPRFAGNPSTTINFALAKTGKVMLQIFAESGQLVRTLIDREMEPGQHTAYWNGRNQSGNPVAAGLYLYQLVVQRENGEVAFTETRRMTVLK